MVQYLDDVLEVVVQLHLVRHFECLEDAHVLYELQYLCVLYPQTALYFYQIQLIVTPSLTNCLWCLYGSKSTLGFTSAIAFLNFSEN